MPAMPGDRRKYLDLRGGRVSTVFLLPSIGDDIEVRAFCPDGSERLEYVAPAIAAAAFLTLVRGLPLDEISVGTPVGSVSVSFNENSGKYEIFLPKCKLLYSNKTVMLSGTAVLVSLLSTKFGNVRITEHNNPELFDDEMLRLMTLSERGENISYCACFSREGGKLRIKSYTNLMNTCALDYLTALAVSSYLSVYKPSCFPLSFMLGDCEAFAELVGGKLKISASVPKPRTFTY